MAAQIRTRRQLITRRIALSLQWDSPHTGKSNASAARPEILRSGWTFSSTAGHPGRPNWHELAIARGLLHRAPGRRIPSGRRRARDRVRHAGRVERRTPAAGVVPRELEIEAQTRHVALDSAVSAPRVQPRADQHPERPLTSSRPSAPPETPTHTLAPLPSTSVSAHRISAP